MLFNPIGELYNLYNRLLERDMVPPFGYVDAPVHAVFVLSDTGDLKEIVPAYTLVKNRRVPTVYAIPRPAIRSRNVKASVLYDSLRYVCGIPDDDDKTLSGYADAEERRCDFYLTLRNVLGRVADTGAAALLKFEENISRVGVPDMVAAAVADGVITSKDRVGFRLDGDDGLLHMRPAIKDAVNTYLADNDDVLRDRVLVDCITGEVSHPKRIHGKVSLPGGQAGGCVLSSINNESVRQQYYLRNSSLATAAPPMSSEVENGYTAALNKLLKEKKTTLSIAGTTQLLIWAETLEDAEVKILHTLLNPFSPASQKKEVKDFIDGYFKSGEIVFTTSKSQDGNGKEESSDEYVNPGKMVYFLAIAPSTARIIVKFSYALTFDEALRNIWEHFRQCDGYWLTPSSIYARALQKVDGKGAAIATSGGAYGSSVTPLCGAILNGWDYPCEIEGLLYTAIGKSMPNITVEMRALLTAFYERNKYKNEGERIKMQSSYPYLVGRMFAVIAAIMRSDSSSVNNETKMAYYSTYTAMIMTELFPRAMNVMQVVNSKVTRRTFYQKELTEISGALESPDILHKNRLNNEEKALFMKGYLGECNKMFTPQRSDEGAEGSAAVESEI